MIKLLIRFLNKIGVLKFMNIYFSQIINGKKFRIPIINSIGYPNLFMTEVWMVELLTILLPLKKGAFVDVGVNIGQTLLKLRSVSEEVEYLGFEPNFHCISYANKLIEDNNFKNTTLIPVGISDKTSLGNLRCFYESKTDACASLLPSEFRPKHKINRIEFVPLFEVTEIKKTIDIPKISILIIDVEGGELEVINSFYEVLKKNKPIIIIEILPCGIENYLVDRQKNIEIFLKNLGYSIFRILKEKNKLFKIIELEEIGYNSDMNYCDYVMIPNEKKEDFQKVLLRKGIGQPFYEQEKT